MKKIITIFAVLTLILCLTLAGCRGGEPSQSTGGLESPETRESPAISDGGRPENTPDRGLSAEATDNIPPSDTPVIPTATAAPEKTKVFLDAGHGGIDPGCIFEEVREKEITLAIVLALKEKLEAAGIQVVLARSGDQDVDLDERWMMANASGAELFVSIHCNSFPDDTVKGFEGYYYQNRDSKKLAELIFSAAENYPSIRTRSIREEDYRVLRNTVMTSVLLEIGYLSNPAERADLQSTEYQDTLAQAIFEGITAMLP